MSDTNEGVIYSALAHIIYNINPSHTNINFNLIPVVYHEWWSHTKEGDCDKHQSMTDLLPNGASTHAQQCYFVLYWYPLLLGQLKIFTESIVDVDQLTLRKQQKIAHL